MDYNRFRYASAANGEMMGASAVPGMAYRHMQWKREGMAGCSSDGRDETYRLLLELSSQEPTMQACFKVIESTCLARGIEVRIRGKKVSTDFQRFVDRYYLPFAETAIRHFFTLGFVPWRLRRISTGDCVPEAVPLGLFTWSIDSIPNRHPFSQSGYVASIPRSASRRSSQPAARDDSAPAARVPGKKRAAEAEDDDEDTKDEKKSRYCLMCP